jgi:transcriptional regulator with AAA-type ATPase domain
MTDKNDPIANALNLTPMVADTMVKEIVAKAHDDSAKNDFEMARANMHEVIQNGLNAIDKLSQIADASQHPRAFEVLAKLMDTVVTANKDLLELQSKIREIDAKDAPTNEHAKSVTNNLFVGSTSDLQKVIENMKNGS